MKTKLNMVMIEGNNSLFIVNELQNGNFNIKAYFDDQDDELGNGSKLWWNTEREPNGKSIKKRNIMETIETYERLERLANEVVNKYIELNK